MTERDAAFERALANFKSELTIQQRNDFQLTTNQDVKDKVKEIQDQHGSSRKLRGMSRMSKFLEAMQQLEQVISVFLNVSATVAFIWGPIKFFLVVASSRLEILECLLDTLTDVSEAMPDLQNYTSVFKEQPLVLEVLERCYGDIIRFYHMAFGVLGRPHAFGKRDWRTMFDSVWKTFRAKFSPILESLRRHRELLAQVKLTATFREIQVTRRALQDSIERSNEELKNILNSLQQQKKQILEKLGANHGSHQGKGHRRMPDKRFPKSGDWILQDSLFLRWLDPNDVSNNLIYLNGMPGAGKTTLVSRIMDSLPKASTMYQRPLLNFYFEHDQSGKTLATDMLRSFIAQLLQQDDAILDDLQQAVLPAHPSEVHSLAWLEDVTTRIVLAQRSCYIIIDGLDECALDQRKHILQWLVKTIIAESTASGVAVKILVSGQRDGVIDAMLQDCRASNIRLDDQTQHLRDIKAFASSKLAQIRNEFPDLDNEEEILEKLDPSHITASSEGMFMYVRIVLDNLLSQTSIDELEQELERSYPQGLDEAYDRVAERVLVKTSDPMRQAALQVLGLIVCAPRPLKWREIQCYFCIDATNGTCNPRKRKVGGPKDLCSSFVESKACISSPNSPFEAQVVMVHNTAKSYLLRSGKIDIVQQHMRMSLFCFQYLTSSAFDLVCQHRDSAVATDLTGFYGLFDYTAAHWDYHSLQYVRQARSRNVSGFSNEELYKSLVKVWTAFVKRFCDKQASLSETTSEEDATLVTTAQQPIASSIDSEDRESGNVDEVFKDWRSIQKSGAFENLAVLLRQTKQRTDLSTLKDRAMAIYVSLNGPSQPKCSRRICGHFYQGFKTEAELVTHLSWHEMAFKCPHEECYAWLTGFPTSRWLQKHLLRVHLAKESEDLLFPVKSQTSFLKFITACKQGNVEAIRQILELPQNERRLHWGPNMSREWGMIAAAQNGHLAACAFLAQHAGVNPYKRTYMQGHSTSAIRESIKLGDYDLFLALRRTAKEGQESHFIQSSATGVYLIGHHGDHPELMECCVYAIKSPIPQFLVECLAWNNHRANPFTLEDILRLAGRRPLAFMAPVALAIHHLVVQERLRTLISDEMERHRKSGLSAELCYERVLVVPDSNGLSMLHRLCDPTIGMAVWAREAVKFLLPQLRPEDSRRHDTKGNPPLFAALGKTSQLNNAQADIIRSFFEHDLEGARSTQNADGHGPLEFAFRSSPLNKFELVVELCGDEDNVLKVSDILAVPPDSISGREDKIRIAFGLDSENLRNALSCLTAISRRRQPGPGLLKLLGIWRRYKPQWDWARLEYSVNDFFPLYESILRSDDIKVIKFLFGLKGTEKLLGKCHLQLEDLNASQLRKLLFISLEAQKPQYGIAKVFLTLRTLDLANTQSEDCPNLQELAARRDMDPEIITLLTVKRLPT